MRSFRVEGAVPVGSEIHFRNGPREKRASLGLQMNTNQEDWQLRQALVDTIRKINRLGLPKHEVPQMQQRLQALCEKHGWPVPKEVGRE